MFNWIFYWLLKQNLSKANLNVRKVARKISRARQQWRDAFRKTTAKLRAKKHWKAAVAVGKMFGALRARKTVQKTVSLYGPNVARGFDREQALRLLGHRS